MVNVRLAERSLLYGHSYLWLATQLVQPSLHWPKFFEIKNRHALLDLRDILLEKKWPLFRQEFGWYLMKLWFGLRLLIISTHIYYLASMLSIHIHSQKKWLTFLGITKENELSYKALYYTPFIQKNVLLVMAIVATKLWRQTEWSIYDKYRIFSLSDATQFKVAVLAMLVSVPDALIDQYEGKMYLRLVPPNHYIIVRLVNDPTSLLGSHVILTKLVMVCSFIVVLVGQSVRHAPLLNVIYAASCVQRHLKVINSQVIMGQQPRRCEQPAPERQALRSVATVEMPSHDSAKVDSVSRSMRHPELNYLGFGSRGRNTSGREPGSASSALTSTDELVSAKQQQQQGKHSSGNNSVCCITNLRDLELHLIKLDFFVCDLDQGAAALVFAMCLLSLSKFIYSIFFLLEFWTERSRAGGNLLLGILYCLSRLTIPFFLFASGNAMENEAKRLLAELEVIYLQQSTQCLIYKQYSSTIGSLSRVIKILGSIRFHCDSLMNINFGTMKQFIFYTVASMFIVVQYGKFVGGGEELPAAPEISGNYLNLPANCYLFSRADLIATTNCRRQARRAQCPLRPIRGGGGGGVGCQLYE